MGGMGLWFGKNVAQYQHRLWPAAFPVACIGECCLDVLGRPAKDKLNALANCTAMVLRHDVPLQGLPVDPLKSLRQSLPLWQEHVSKPAVDRMLEAVERRWEMAGGLNGTYSV
ncbi:hypothetical protein [Vulcanococcus limneticus]|uniref:hypothetical protein n=2 Tax=Vulcanococcus limneticus TaxID=2170428 RepID=UPI000B98E725|nr:hypothetical protein [Vulcanococcus limneticus]